MNSVDCNFGPGTDFLEEYKLLLKADIDTFPTPYLLGWWPKQVVMGSSWYGDSRRIRNMARLTVALYKFAK